MVFRELYILDFLNRSASYSERDLETAILRDIEAFLLEMGGGFSFVTRQKRMVIDGEDRALDLLFYHRRLRRLVAMGLKLGKFKASYKAQMSYTSAGWKNMSRSRMKNPRWAWFFAPKVASRPSLYFGWTSPASMSGNTLRSCPIASHFLHPAITAA
jgi:hypothetical protein